MDSKINQRIGREIQKQKYRALKNSAIIASTMMGVYSLFLMTLFFIESIPINEIILYLFVFVVVLSFNVISIVKSWRFEWLTRLGMLNVLFIYTFITYLLFNQSLPGIFANLFIAFTIGFIYLDSRTATLNHVLMTFTSSLVLWVFPEILAVEESTFTQLGIINASIVVVMIFLYLSAIFNIRMKQFNYEKLAKSKENEYRIIQGLFDFQKEVLNDPINTDVFFKDMHTFFESFTQKLEMENVFEKRLQLIEDLHQLSLSKAKKKYKEIPEEIIIELQSLTLSDHQKLRYLAYRISQIYEDSQTIIDPKDAFNSFRHYDDSEAVKIMVFGAFYVYFRHPDVDRDAYSHQAFMDLLNKSGIDRLVEPRILKTFTEYQDVIETIMTDAIDGVEVPL